MTAVKFDWLNEVGLDLECELNIRLAKTVDGNVVEYVWANVDLKSKIEAIEVSNSIDPQNSFDKDFSVQYVDKDTVCFARDWSDNIHAIQDMPFKLTGDQINTINDYLKDEAKPV